MDHRPLPAASSETMNDASLPFRNLIGALYYAIITRPDIAYAVHALSQHNASYTAAHFEQALRILRYLGDTKRLRLSLTASDSTINAPITIRAYSDADFASDIVTRRSVSGGILMIGNAIVHHFVQRQSSVATSSMEAEFVSLASTVSELLWLKMLLAEIGVLHESPMTVFCDSQAAAAYADHATQHRRSKHIDIAFHFVRERIADGTIAVEWIPSQDMLADILTKPLGTQIFTRLRQMLLSN
jgi:hypothetical protein